MTASRGKYWPSAPFHFNCSLYRPTCSPFSCPVSFLSFLFLSFCDTCLYCIVSAICASTKTYVHLQSGEDKTLNKNIPYIRKGGSCLNNNIIRHGYLWQEKKCFMTSAIIIDKGFLLWKGNGFSPVFLKHAALMARLYNWLCNVTAFVYDGSACHGVVFFLPRYSAFQE